MAASATDSDSLPVSATGSAAPCGHWHGHGQAPAGCQCCSVKLLPMTRTQSSYKLWVQERREKIS